jgi:hypothetical protein
MKIMSFLAVESQKSWCLVGLLKLHRSAEQNGWWRVSQLHKIRGEEAQLLFFADSSSFWSHLFLRAPLCPVAACH